MNGNPLRARRTPPPPPVYDASLTRLRSFVRSSQRASVFSTSSKRNISANASRPIWYPGNESEIPAYLDGSLAGDYGFDPLGLGSSPEQLAWNVEAELIHARLAMMGVAGCLYASFAHSAGAPVAEWYEAGKVYMDAHPEVSFGALVWTTVALSGFVEFKRLGDIRSRGSQNDGVVKILGGDEFKGVEPSYPGGPLFDPMGLSRGSPEKYQEYKTKEIKNGRLAMVAFVGFAAQYAATGAGPLANLAAHLADPAHANFAHNGVSVPFISN